MHDPRLLRMQLHPQLVQNPKRRGHCRSRFPRRFTGYYPIIGVPRKLISLASHLLIKWRQKYVTEQRRNYPTLRSPALARKESPFTIASCLERRPYQAQHPTVRYSLGHQREEFLMIHGPEGPFDTLPTSKICLSMSGSLAHIIHLRGRHCLSLV